MDAVARNLSFAQITYFGFVKLIQETRL